jgi:hypothetical protein
MCCAQGVVTSISTLVREQSDYILCNCLPLFCNILENLWLGRAVGLDIDFSWSKSMMYTTSSTVDSSIHHYPSSTLLIRQEPALTLHSRKWGRGPSHPKATVKLKFGARTVKFKSPCFGHGFWYDVPSLRKFL